MFKFLVISFLLFFIIYKLLGFFFRMLIRGSASNYQQQKQYQYNGRNGQDRRPADGNVNIDYIPDNNKKKKKERPAGNYNGGEYIDYEEVK